MTAIHDTAVDFMEMPDDRRLWARVSDVREGFEPAVGRCAIVGDDDAEPLAAQIEDITHDGLLQLEVLPGRGLIPDSGRRCRVPSAGR